MPYHDAVRNSLDRLTRNNDQFTILHESISHTNPQLFDFLAEEQTMAMLAKNGFKDIAMEVRKEVQGIADSVSSGKITPQEYAAAKAKIYLDAGDPTDSTPYMPHMIAEG